MIKLDEEIIRRLLNREYPNSARISSTRDRCGNRCEVRDEDCPAQQSHVHEFAASTFLSLEEPGCQRHNHRLAGMTSEAIPIECGGHKHVIYVNTDTFGRHHHEVGVETGPAIDVGNDKHIHFASIDSTLDAFHFHNVMFTTAIQNPLLLENNVRENNECKCECRCECCCEHDSKCERRCNNNRR